MTEIILHASSTDKVKNAITKYKPGSKHDAIGSEMKKLADILIEIKSMDIKDSVFSSLPVIGGYLNKIKKEHIENKYSDYKVLIEELTSELTKKCSEINQDDLMLEPIINSLKSDISKNKESYDKLIAECANMQAEVDSTENEVEKIEKSSKMTVMTQGLNNLSSLLKNQTIYLAELISIKTQNASFITTITTTINTSVNSIATGLIIAQHLKKRKELMDISNVCRDVAAEMTYKTAEAMKIQTEEYKKILSSDSIDNKRLDEAISLIENTYKDFNNFTKVEIPRIMDKLTESSESIDNLVLLIDSSDKVRLSIQNKNNV